MNLSDLHGTDGSSEESAEAPKDSEKPASENLADRVEEMSQELLFQLNERDELVNAIQLKNRFIGKLPDNCRKVRFYRFFFLSFGTSSGRSFQSYKRRSNKCYSSGPKVKTPFFFSKFSKKNIFFSMIRSRIRMNSAVKSEN